MINDTDLMITHSAFSFGLNTSAGFFCLRILCFVLLYFISFCGGLEAFARAGNGGWFIRYPGFALGGLTVCFCLISALCFIPCIGFTVGCSKPGFMFYVFIFYNTLYFTPISSPHFLESICTLTLHTYERGRKGRQRSVARGE